jgi:hydrogenase-4 membrane subunit HyfE
MLFASGVRPERKNRMDSIPFRSFFILCGSYVLLAAGVTFALGLDLALQKPALFFACYLLLAVAIAAAVSRKYAGKLLMQAAGSLLFADGFVSALFFRLVFGNESSPGWQVEALVAASLILLFLGLFVIVLASPKPQEEEEPDA